MTEFGLTLGLGLLALVFAAVLVRSYPQSEGLRRDVRDAGDVIRTGARAFAQTHFRTLPAFFLLVAFVLVVAFAFLRSHKDGDANPTPIETACWVAGSFLLGTIGVLSATHIGLWNTNLCTRRLISSSRTSAQQLLVVGLRSMATSGILCVAIPLIAAAMLSAGGWIRLVGSFSNGSRVLVSARLPALFVAFSFGACLSSLVARILGSVFRSAVGLVVQRSDPAPQSRSQQATELSRLVAGGVHHAMESCADISGSLSAVTIAAMASGASLCGATVRSSDQLAFLVFGPLLSGFGLLASAVGIFVVRCDHGERLGPAIDRGMASTIILALAGQLACSRWVFGAGWLPFFGASVAGLGGAVGGIVASRWHASISPRPLTARGLEAESGPLAVLPLLGMVHGVQRASILLVCLAVPIALGYAAGARSGLEGGEAFGVVVAATTLLGPAAYMTAVGGMAKAASVGARLAATQSIGAGTESGEICGRLQSLVKAGCASALGFSSIGAAGATIATVAAFLEIARRMLGGMTAPSGLGVWTIAAISVLVAIVLGWFVGRYVDAVIRTTLSATMRIHALAPSLEHGQEGVEFEHAPNRPSDRRWYLAALMQDSLRHSVPVILAGLAIAFSLDVGCLLVATHLDRSQAMNLVGVLLVTSTIAGLMLSFAVEGVASALKSIWKLWKTDSSKVKSTVDDGSEWENNCSCGAAVGSETVGGTLGTMAAPALQSLLKVLATVSLVLAPLFF